MDAGPGVTGVAAGESQGSESHVTRGGGGALALCNRCLAAMRSCNR